ncbi:MAG: alpha-galactosidase [Planctomycetota bacterium]|jgi:alpha-galactosidase
MAKRKRRRAKVVFIGAGSFGFTRSLVKDLLTFDRTRDAEICLVDINKQRLSFARRAVQRIVDSDNYPATVTATTDRREVLKGADAVMVTILCGDVNVWQHDIVIPKKYGVDINVGDTRGVSGIFRALRTIPTMLDIAADMEELCPHAVMLNYTNPMAMLCHAMQRTSKVAITGLCHSVQGTAMEIADWCGVPREELVYTCAGINHTSWFTRLEHKGKDLYPKLKQVVAADKAIREMEPVRSEMLMALDYYVTESSGHNSEYNWWFRKRPDLIRTFCNSKTCWNPGTFAYILKCYQAKKDNWKRLVREALAAPVPVPLVRGYEYAASIVNAWLGETPFQFNGNVPNTGLVTNLPEGACVEVPVLATRGKLSPIHVGALPPQCAILTDLSARTEMMAVDAHFRGDAKLVYQAICHDPLTAAKLSLAEIKTMTKEMFRKFKNHLPQFKSLDF